jgi:uncharacterized membrane protein
MTKAIRANMLVGIFLTVPLVATILIFNFLLHLGTNWLLHTGAFPGLREIWSGYLLRALTLIAVLVVFYFVGLFTRNILGRRLYQFGDKILTRIPFVKGIYISVRQISESLFTQRKTLFKEVVLIEYPRHGLYSLAFVTATAPPRVEAAMKEREDPNDPCVSLFISTTPNPTSGVFLMARRSELIPLKIPVTDALTFIMSAGAVAPGQDGMGRPTLLDKLEAWLRQDGDTPEKEERDAADRPAS